mmetsp:Transcript_21322/g.62087  ORF Transcript_21322/g.62087 Transcript_21322/m.62087 type:complete len:81 (+) Transcript_21322:591-833(+)
MLADEAREETACKAQEETDEAQEDITAEDEAAEDEAREETAEVQEETTAKDKASEMADATTCSDWSSRTEPDLSEEIGEK